MKFYQLCKKIVSFSIRKYVIIITKEGIKTAWYKDYIKQPRLTWNMLRVIYNSTTF